ncbi:MAG: TetR/AcrR family transcriptional regulator [Halieaceae bacterium]|jgi:AcrR family transcriptional regulator|nr:TetR/AcrR family transcriptional regulator [Halieaceae bacterium]
MNEGKLPPAMQHKSDVKRRNAHSHNAIIDATIKLLGSTGYVDFSIEKVASEAGVGKQTIYRWWPSRADLVLEVWRDRLLPPLAPYDGKIPLRNYLESSLFSFGHVLSRTDCRQAAICVLAEAHRDTQLYRRMEEAVYAPRIGLIADAVRRAQEKEQFPGRLDIDLMIDTLYGAVWYKVLIRFEKVTRTYIKKLVAQTLGDDKG